MKLRDYQQECLNIINNIESGSYIISLATGLGKTVIFTHMETQGKVLIVSHREELVFQPEKYYTNKTFSVEMGKHIANMSSDVVSTCIASMHRRYKKFDEKHFDTIIIDECFPSGTLIDNIPIENIKSGDIITSYNHQTNKIEKQKVINTFKNKPSSMIKLALVNGEEIFCTSNHPVYTKRGYIPAIELNKNDELLYMRETNRSINTVERSKISIQKNKSSLLFKRMSSNNIIYNNVKYKQKTCFKKNDRKQSDEETRNKKKSFRNIKKNRSLSKNKRWKRSRFNTTSIKIINRFNKIKSDSRICYPYKRKTTLSKTLQNRCRFTISRFINRNRWWLSQSFNQTRTRSKKRNLFNWTRLEGIKIYKPTSDGTFGGLCKDGYVYNIEVAKNHNYFVNNVLVHNCHHSSAKSYQTIIDYFKPRLLLGFTATPNRADNVRLDTIYKKIIYKKDLIYGIKNNYLTDINCKRCYLDYDLRKCKSSGGDYKISDLENELLETENPKAIGEIYQKHAKGQTLIFAVSVSHCEEIQKYIPDSVVISANTKNRADIIKDFTNRKIPCIINCMIFTEGTDLPLIETIIIARPTKNESLYSQMVGRGLRLSDGKDKLNLIDCVGVSDLSICTAPTLVGIDYQEPKEKPDELIEADLFDLPDIISKVEDIPENWIVNYKKINLWAKKRSYKLHDVNWFKHSDGSFSLNIGKNLSLKTGPIDEVGKLTFKNKEYDAQDFFDRTYLQLKNKYQKYEYIWNLNIVKNWGYSPASEKQLNLITNKLPNYDSSNLNKIQACMILNRIMN